MRTGTINKLEIDQNTAAAFLVPLSTFHHMTLADNWLVGS